MSDPVLPSNTRTFPGSCPEVSPGRDEIRYSGEPSPLMSPMRSATQPNPSPVGVVNVLKTWTSGSTNSPAASARDAAGITASVNARETKDLCMVVSSTDEAWPDAAAPSPGGVRAHAAPGDEIGVKRG